MLKIDGQTRVCGLIGNPVEHTLSPVIHNTLAEREGRKLVYVPFLVEKGQAMAAVRGAFALNVLGLNVTVPYKSEVIAALSAIDDMAGKIGAVNTLVRTEDGYKGYNTDMMGLYRAMCEEGLEIRGEEVLVLGAGGAARAVAFLCAGHGAGHVYLLNRTLEKAQKIASEVNRTFARECIIPLMIAEHGKLPDKKYLAIQATSVGLYPNTEDAVITDPAFYQKIHTGFDLIYRPADTKFMSLVRESGGKAYCGLKMLLYQGIIAYELWNGIKVTKADVQAVYEKMKETMGITQ